MVQRRSAQYEPDEPTGNLDSKTGQSILDLMQFLNREEHLSIVLVSHGLFAAAYGHRMVELRDGRVVRESRPSRAAAGGAD